MSPASSRVYDRLLRLVGTDRIAVAPDTPGFGESDPPPEAREISDFAATNFDLLNQLEISEPVDVLGYHTGTLTAAEMALQQPDAIRRLVLISTPLFTPEELAALKVAYQSTPIDEAGTHLVERWRQLRDWGDRAQSLENTMEHFAEHLRGGARADWGVRAAFNYRLQDTLPRLDHSILVLNPDDDLTSQTLRSTEYLRNGRLQALPGWSHGMLDAHTEEIAELLRGFLDD